MHGLTIILCIWAVLVLSVRCLDKRQGTTSTEGPFFDRSTQQICGYVTEDVNAPYGCDGSYCNTVSGYFACCQSVTSSNYTTTSYATWYYTESLTTSRTNSGLDSWVFTDVSYAYQTCGWWTTCYDYNLRPLTTKIADLVCSDTAYPACQMLTMSHEFPNTTYTAFRCAEISFTQALYSTYTYPTNGTAAATTTSISQTPANTVPTSVTQQSIPASAAATITTTMPSPTNGAKRDVLQNGLWVLLPLALAVYYHNTTDSFDGCIKTNSHS